MYGALVYVFVGFWDRGYVCQLPDGWYYVVVKRRFNMLVMIATQSGSMCFRCMMFSLLGPCELFLLCYIMSWIYLS